MVMKVFVLSGGVFLLLSGVAKLISSFGGVRILDEIDPVFAVSYRMLFLIVGIVEVVIGVVCTRNRNLDLSLMLLLWISSCFLCYRAGRWFMGVSEPCGCLGNFSDAIGLSSVVSDNAMKVIAVYLFFGSLLSVVSAKVRSRLVA